MRRDHETDRSAVAALAVLPATMGGTAAGDPSRSDRPAGNGATRCRRATRSPPAFVRGRPPATRSGSSARSSRRPTAAGPGRVSAPAPFTNLGEVQAIDAQALFVGGGCVARRSDDGGQTFSRVAFTPVESSCPQAARGGLVGQPDDRLPRARGRHRPAHRQQRPELRDEGRGPRHPCRGRKPQGQRHRLPDR